MIKLKAVILKNIVFFILFMKQAINIEPKDLNTLLFIIKRKVI